MTILEDERSTRTPPQPDAPFTTPPPPPPWQDSGETPPPGGRDASRPLLSVLLVVLLAAGLVAGRLWAAQSQSSASLDGAGTAAAVDPAVVDINTTLAPDNARAAGTGIVISGSGEVLTNNHVIERATTIAATDVGNGRTYTATVVGYDATHDLAVLQLLGASHLKTAKLATSAPAIGDTVTGLGNAGGTGGAPAVVTGTVTQVGASITASDGSGSAEQLTGLIQMNLPLQPGDSGGPLVNTTGKVVGIDTAASTGFAFRSVGSESFAVPIATAVDVAAQIEAGTASTTVHIGDTAFLGVEVQPVVAAGGVVVAGVESGSAAASAGISAGATIVSLDGTATATPSDLSAAIQQHHPGDNITVVWTDQTGQSHTASVTLLAGPAR